MRRDRAREVVGQASLPVLAPALWEVRGRTFGTTRADRVGCLQIEG